MSKNNWVVHVLRKIQKKIESVNSNEPYIKQNRDRLGNLCWHIYDRRTNKSYTFGSELEVIAWLEQCYYSA